MTRVLYKPQRKVVIISENRVKVIMAAPQGPDSVAPAEYTQHIENKNNPHEVALLQLKVNAADVGRWVRVNAAGTALEVCAAPLTEAPVYPDPPDEKVKVDAGDTSGYLDAKVAGALWVDTTEHKLKLKGATGDTVLPNYYYGTNASGVLGFWSLADLITPSGIAADNEEEWLNTGSVAFWGMPEGAL
ncbi:hypothetical protein [Cloacibacillus evryensis]|uniref:hypothetical protein n=1 Tax=Cloacibacillus evryensis TaxID=508460 RepID=UPI002B1F7628|nr:hypothetical protein [Cloacibacillus evryensis]MEA5034239.1 hypothetical protein [Cloacibacillus evryensis]